MAAKYMAYAAQFLSLMILARVFSPETFGLVGAIQVFYVFFQLIAEAGFGPAIIALSKLPSEERDGIFSFMAMLGLLLASAFWLTTPWLTAFYELPELRSATPYIAAGLAFTALSILPVALLQRQQCFFHIGLSAVIAESFALLATLAATAVLDPLHALALRIPVFSATYFILAYIFSSKGDFGRPTLGYRVRAIAPLLRVSGYQLAFNILNFFSRNLDNILVAKYLGASSLGIYDRSYQLMRYPLQLLGFAMAPAIQPALRAQAYNEDYVLEVHSKLCNKLSLLGVATAIPMYLLADTIVMTAFGEQWLDAVPVIQILALAIPVQVVLATSGSFFQTMGRTDLLFLCGVITAGTNIFAIASGVMQGSLSSLCWAILASFHINFLVVYAIMHKFMFKAGLLRFMSSMAPAAAAVAVMIAWHANRST